MESWNVHPNIFLSPQKRDRSEVEHFRLLRWPLFITVQWKSSLELWTLNFLKFALLSLCSTPRPSMHSREWSRTCVHQWCCKPGCRNPGVSPQQFREREMPGECGNVHMRIVVDHMFKQKKTTKNHAQYFRKNRISQQIPPAGGAEFICASLRFVGMERSWKRLNNKLNCPWQIQYSPRIPRFKYWRSWVSHAHIVLLSCFFYKISTA